MNVKNLLVLQAGMPSVVGNAILYGVLTEALNHEAIENIYGAYNGFEGIGSKEWIDLATIPQKKAKALLTTAGCVLGRENIDFQPTLELFQTFIPLLDENAIRYVVVIGDQGALESVSLLIQAAELAHYDLQVMMVPHANDNAIPITDHSLGYGSVLKCLNSCLLSFYQILHVQQMPIGICEVNGGHNGWVVAGAALLQNFGKNLGFDRIPYVVCMPEQPFQEAVFLESVHNQLQGGAPVLIVTHSHLMNEVGTNLDTSQFGSAGGYLSHLIQRELNFPTRSIHFDLNEQSCSYFIARHDQEEAQMCGRAALEACERGETGKAVIMGQNTHNGSQYEITCVPFADMAANAKFFPSDWISANTMTLSHSMVKYALPLIQGEVAVPYEKGLPCFVTL